MTHTITFPLGRKVENFGSLKAVIARVDVTSYTASGEVISPASFGLRSIGSILPRASEKGYVMIWNQATKLLVHFFDYNNVADGPSIEETAAVDCGEFDLLVLGTL